MTPDRGARGIVFDLFHTLVDPEAFRPRGFSRLRHAATVLGVDEADLSRYWDQMSLRRNTDASIGVAGLLAEYLRRAGRTASAALLEEVEAAFGRYQDQAIMQPEAAVVAALQTWRGKGLRLGVLSNADAREARTWGASPLASLVDAACFSCEIGVAKPDRRAYQAVLDRLGLPAAVCLFVGDGGSGELAGARAAGFRVVVFMRGHVARSGLRPPPELARLAAEADGTVDVLQDLDRYL